MDDKKKDAISNLLNISPIVKEGSVVLYEEPLEVETQLDQDLEYSRQIMYDNIKNTQDALEEMLDIAKQSQHPKAFDTLNSLLNTSRNAAKDLLEFHKEKKAIKQEAPESSGTTNNNLFVGSTAELLRMMKDKKNGDN